MKYYNNKNKLKFRIVTSIIPNSEVDFDVYQSLEAVRRYFRIDKIEAIPTLHNTKYDIGMYNIDGLDIDILSEAEYDLRPDLIVSDDPCSVNKKSYVLANPEGDCSVIIPAPSFQSEPISRQIKSEPTDKHIWCSGTISKSYYKKTVGGKYASRLHDLGLGGLLIEEQSNGSFRIHKLQYKNGMICLLKWKFWFDSKKDKHIVEEQKVKAVIPGDEHPDEIDLDIAEDNIRLINALKCPFVFHHDWFNGTTITHHAEGNIVVKNKIFRHIGKLEDEVKLCSDFWFNYAKRCKYVKKHYYVRSNHPEHLIKYLEQSYRHDYVNYDTAVEYNHFRFQNSNEQSFWHKIFGKYNKFDNKKHQFLSQKDLVKMGGFVCSEHGMDGNNGARGSLRALDRLILLIIGHSHSPRQGRKGSIQVGTSTHLILNYTSQSGTSGWSHALAYINENNTATLLIAIDKNYTQIV